MVTFQDWNKRFLKIVKNNNNLILCFSFALILGFSVGFTSYNLVL